MNIVFSRVYSCEAYGLNKFRSLLNAEHDLYIEDLHEFIYDTLSDIGCMDSAVFAHSLDNVMTAGIYNIEDDSVDCYECQKYDPNFFISIDANYLCSFYILIVEVEPNIWRVVSE